MQNGNSRFVTWRFALGDKGGQGVMGGIFRGRGYLREGVFWPILGPLNTHPIVLPSCQSSPGFPVLRVVQLLGGVKLLRVVKLLQILELLELLRGEKG